MAQSQSKLSLERELMEQIRLEQISSPEQFNEAVMRVFDGVIGSFGRTEFEQHVIPTLLPRHRDNYEAAGRRALRIIDEGSYKKRSEIADYFKNALGAPAPRARKTHNAPQKVHGNIEESKPKGHEYKPQLNRYPEFSPLANQDKLREGLLKTKDRGYLHMGDFIKFKLQLDCIILVGNRINCMKA